MNDGASRPQSAEAEKETETRNGTTGVSASWAAELAAELAAAAAEGTEIPALAPTDATAEAPGPADGADALVAAAEAAEEAVQAWAAFLRARLDDGRGEWIGTLTLTQTPTLDPNALAARLAANLNTAAARCSAVATLLDGLRTAHGRTTAHTLVRRRPGRVEELLEVRVACTGNVDAGKSTLLGVLTRSVLDDGRGRARVSLFRHKHEIDSGRTSSVGSELVGFGPDGQVLTAAMLGRPRLTWADVCTHASKVLSLIDLAGHERYLKTTVYGMTGWAPDYVLLMVGANAGIIGMTKEHLGLALAVHVPVIVVVTKIDMCPPNILDATRQQLVRILRSAGGRRQPLFVATHDDAIESAAQLGAGGHLVPIFQVSNVTGENLDLLRFFLNLLRVPAVYQAASAPGAPVEFQITETFSVPGVGAVVSGVLTSGRVAAGDHVALGPDSAGRFIRTQVRSIQRKRVPVQSASAGQSVSFSLRKIRRSQVGKGMVLLGPDAAVASPAMLEFEADVLILFHSTTISPRYQAMLHSGCIRQTVRVVRMDRPVLRTKDRARVVFRFLQRPEYLKVGARVLFREGRTKGIGMVTAVFPGTA